MTTTPIPVPGPLPQTDKQGKFVHPVVHAPGGGAQARWEIPPPTPLVTTPGDTLLVRCVNSVAGVTLTLRARFMDPDGEVHNVALPLVSAATKLEETVSMQLHYGYLLGLAMDATGATVRRGQCFAGVWLVRGITANKESYEQLAVGYPTTGNPLGWPENVPQQSVEGNGFPRTFVQAAPGPGADQLITVPAGSRWQLMSGRLQLTTAVAVANRFTHVQVLDGAGNVLHDVAGQVQAASLTFTTVIPVGTGPELFNDNTQMLAMPSNLTLLQGWQLRTLTTALQGADQYSAWVLGVLEWMEE